MQGEFMAAVITLHCIVRKLCTKFSALIQCVPINSIKNQTNWSATPCAQNKQNIQQHAINTATKQMNTNTSTLQIHPYR